MSYHFGPLAIVLGTTAFDDVIDVPNLTYRYNSLLQHKPQLLQLIYMHFHQQTIGQIDYGVLSLYY